ncbi:MAG: translation initiation factor 2, partial [bacterium]|nr:translation initiation factor 2 [bacterium]
EAEKQKETAARQKAETDLEQESQARLQAVAEVERLKAQLRQIQAGGDG